MARLLRLAMLCSILAGCAAEPPRPPPPMINDPALSAALDSLLCRVEPECHILKLQVVDRAFEQAEMFPDGRLQMNIGLLLATQDEAEIAFVLAHETAHRRLGHRLAISAETRTRLELEADADAVRALRDSSLRSDAGLRLLERLLAQAREAHIRSEVSAKPTAAGERRRQTRRDEALSQIEARIDALRVLARSPDLETLPANSDWQRLLAQYRLKAGAPASPPSQNPPSDP